MMSNYRVHGKPPYKVAVIHGGPGGAGTLKKLAKKLSDNHGALEPLQTKDSIEGQLQEFKQTLDRHSDLPITLIGHSWGAMLGYLFAAKHPEYVQKLIMIGSGLFHSQYAKNLIEIRLNRMPQDEQSQLLHTMELNHIFIFQETIGKITIG